MAVEQIGTGNPDGAVLGASASEKIGFYGATPVTQAAHISDPTTTGSSLAAAVASILTTLESLGLTASS